MQKYTFFPIETRLKFFRLFLCDGDVKKAHLEMEKVPTYHCLPLLSFPTPFHRCDECQFRTFETISSFRSHFVSLFSPHVTQTVNRLSLLNVRLGKT